MPETFWRNRISEGKESRDERKTFTTPRKIKTKENFGLQLVCFTSCLLCPYQAIDEIMESPHCLQNRRRDFLRKLFGIYS